MRTIWWSDWPGSQRKSSSPKDRRFYRDSTIANSAKPLSLFGFDLRRIILVDNAERSFDMDKTTIYDKKYQRVANLPANGIIVHDFVQGQNPAAEKKRELWRRDITRLRQFLTVIASPEITDVRRLIMEQWNARHEKFQHRWVPLTQSPSVQAKSTSRFRVTDIQLLSPRGPKAIAAA
jgi:hypothetical protein